MRIPSARATSLFAPSRLIPAMALMSLIASTSAQAQDVNGSMWVPNGQVNAIATSGTTIYIGGHFTHVGPITGACAGIDAGSGVLRHGWPRVNGAVYCSVADGAGGWYVGGDFTSVAGVPRTSLAHIRADASLDGWNPGVFGTVSALAVSGTTVYVGGGFDSIGGQNRKNIAALDSGTGLTTAWDPHAGGGDVRSLAVSGTKVYVGGSFTSIGGQSRLDIAALDAGTGQATAWDPGADGPVFALALSGTTVYAGGSFSGIGGQS